jgi:dTDP-4-dehydrorhamnose 3,5-epimerase
MLFTPLGIDGVFGITEPTKSDFRGALTRVWDIDSQLKSFDLNQSSVVTNPTAGTLRGLHYQTEPFSENKIVECITGTVFDVILDLRKDSATQGNHLAYEIGPTSQFLGLFIPAGCAHGYLTLETNSTLIYFMDREFSPMHSHGVLWNDPRLSILWPSDPILISEQDKGWKELA